jgi:hypothetical protein
MCGFNMFWFIIFCFVVGFIWSAINNDGTTQNSSNSNQKSNQNLGNTDGSFRIFFPMVDIFVHFSLLDNRTWNQEKVKYIKEVFEPRIRDEDSKNLLQERLKRKERYSIAVLADNFMNVLGTLAEKQNFVSCKQSILGCVCDILLIDGHSSATIRSHVTDLGNRLELNRNEIEAVLVQNLKENNFYSERGGTDSDDSGSVQWACKMLDIPLNQITPENVQKAYRAKIKDFHPDKYQSLPNSIVAMLHEKTVELNAAKEVLLSVK